MVVALELSEEPMLLIPDDVIQLAGQLADAAGPVLRRYYRSPMMVDTKADSSPVTQADREAEKLMREMIRNARPRDGIVGEEYGAEGLDAEWTWVLDPIDGTRSFIAGRPLFGTLIALLYQGEPMIGVIDMPITRDRWVGVRGHATSFNGMPCRTRSCGSLGQATLATTSPKLFAPSEARVFDALSGSVRDTLYGGDCSNYGYLASGTIDAVVETGLKLHDFAALVPVIEGAGGAIVDWSGQPLNSGSDGRIIAVGDPRLVEELLG